MARGKYQRTRAAGEHARPEADTREHAQPEAGAREHARPEADAREHTRMQSSDIKDLLLVLFVHC